MSRTTSALGLLVALGMTACDSSTSPQIRSPQASLAPAQQAAVQGLSARDQAAVDLFNESRTSGAFVVRDCVFVSPGWFGEDGRLLGFGGLFPDVPDGESCGFTRTNPDGSEDLYVNGKGYFFLFLFEPFHIYGSEGSDVKWTYINRADGVRILTITGTLSDGSRVRAHFTSGDNQAGSLWVEGLGYVVGSPGGM